MRNSKRFLSLVVAALMSASAVATSASAAKFTDVDANNEALNDAVELLTALGVAKGTTETTFGTEEGVTRQQMAAFIYRMMNAGKSVEGGDNFTSFADLDDSTYYFMVSWANSQGIIKGRSATAFDPKGGITLQDAYTMIVRALGYDDGTLAYPISYISKAEELGLDEDLPSSLNYTDTLTRGDVAIILANMFYAETAEVEIKYEASWKEVTLSDGTVAVVSNGQTPVEYQKTVAEKIFEVEKVSQRVVATPNYSFGGIEKPDEDTEMITLSAKYVIDYDDYDTDIPSLGQIEFAELGLEGSADDYFLNDIVMFVKENDKDEYEIFGATATGSKKTVSFDEISFGTISGTSAEKYYDGSEKEYKIINGLLTIDGVKTYLFDAPYSYAKDQDTNKYNAKFITLDSFDGDMEEEKIYMNYVFDATMNDVIESDDVDTKEVVGTYHAATDTDKAYWDYNGILSQMYFGGLGEVDCYDCDNDGRYDYLFVKNYLVGTIDDEEDGKIMDVNSVDPDDDADSTTIYTDMSIVEGVEAADEDIVLAYVNPEANYVKIAEVLTGVDATVSTSATKYFALSTGEKVYYKDAKAVVVNGEANLKKVDADADIDFNAEATYYFAENGKLVFVTGLSTAINLNDNYVVVLEEKAYQSTALVDGVIEKAYYIDIYNDGAIKSVKAKKIAATSSTYKNNIAAGDDSVALTPVIDDSYDFSKYVNKLATGKSDKKGAYYFKLLDYTINTDITALEDKNDENKEYRMLSGKNNVEFYKKSGYIYNLSDATSASGKKIKGVYVKPYTQIIIKSLDKDGEDVVALYGYDNLPDIKENTKFSNVSYVLVNNVNSTAYENLAVFYGTLSDELKGAKGDVAEVRVVKSYSKSSTDDGTVYTYDVFNPEKGTIETGIDGAETDPSITFVKGDIVGLTANGYIDDEVEKAGNAFTAGKIYNTEDYDFEDYGVSESAGALGYVEVAEYDKTTGYLEIVGDTDNMYVITDETVVSFSDKSEETIKVVDADTFNSTSKNYRQNEDKKNAIRVFMTVELDDDASDDGENFYNVLYAMIVRD